MGFDLSSFRDEQFAEDFLEWLVDERSIEINQHFTKFWEYYVNQMYEIADVFDRNSSRSGRCYMQAQERGLPSRITGVAHRANGGVEQLKDIQRKEIVIENDIAWRINAAVDFLFGKPVRFVSKSPEARKSAEIESILKALFSANGGIGFFQDMAVLGSVYGFVDCIIRPGQEILEHLTRGSQALSLEDALRITQTIDIELIEAPRALPVLDENDYKKVKYYVQHFHQKKNVINRKNTFLSRLVSDRGNYDSRDVVSITEIISPTHWQRYENGELAAEGDMPWGFLPVIHIQNMAQPFYYEGFGDVEPLMPMQDELNTRLSDRANRITFQSFKMYLGKGIEGFEDKPVSPGRMWYTDNAEASIDEFGGDAATPSEDLHIAEIREAMDKTSGVTAIAAGILKNRLGALTSAVALRLTMMGMLSKNERKRFTYGEGLKRICEMALAILDKANIYRTNEAEREVEIIFPSPLPENLLEKLKEAQIKKELGVPSEQVLKELGY